MSDLGPILKPVYVLMAKNCDGFRAPVGVFTSKSELEHSIKHYTECVNKTMKSYKFYVLEFIDGVVNPKLTFGIDFF